MDWQDARTSKPSHKEWVFVWLVPMKDIRQARFKNDTYEGEYGDLFNVVDSGEENAFVSHWCRMNGPD